MESRESREECDLNLLIHLWRERGERHSFWRGRIMEVGGERCGYFQDARSLIAFLDKAFGIVLPMRQGRGFR
jgi:hypothetical protein